MDTDTHSSSFISKFVRQKGWRHFFLSPVPVPDGFIIKETADNYEDARICVSSLMRHEMSISLCC
ncbi:unnamed protein product [Amoebophrya sp. A25]|nr:unnamed protein product [Amoebophrya sp. A25]|eukprot:GSA25T00005019001.1